MVGAANQMDRLRAALPAGAKLTTRVEPPNELLIRASASGELLVERRLTGRDFSEHRTWEELIDVTITSMIEELNEPSK